MEKEHRSGVDVRVALATCMKVSLARSIESVARVQGEIAPAVLPPPTSATIHVDGPKDSPWRAITMSARWIARRLLRIIKPVLRPILSRTRQYFTILLQEQLHRLQQDVRVVQQAQQQAQQQGNEREAATRQLIEETALRLHRRALSTAVLEMSAIREGLRADLVRTAAQIESTVLPRLDLIEQYGYASTRRVAVPCGPNDVLVRSAVGYVLCSATDYAQLACLVDTGEIERGTRLLLERLLSSGDTFVDVGANLGLHTLAAARAMKGRGRIVAFEPFAPTFELMQKSIWLNGFSQMVESHQAAVSNSSGRQHLHLGASSGHHSLFPLVLPSGFKGERVEVPLVKLDDVLASAETVEVIKIDTEGAELEVVEGGTALIERSPEIALVVEFGPAHVRRTSRSASEWFAPFARLGLRYRAINEYTGALEDLTIEDLNRMESVNLLFARAESRAWRRTEVKP